MTEEQVTKCIMKWLMENDWRIVCFDFPQSGTGRFLHPNNSENDKNKGAINPDIVAVKQNTCVFFENKDRFYFPDYEKINYLRSNNDYSHDIDALLSNHPVSNIFYGIGLPSDKHDKRSQEASYLVDFIIGVNADMTISNLYCTIQGLFE